MPKAGFIIAPMSLCVLAAGLLGVGLLAAPTAGATSSTCIASGKCFAVDVSPSSHTAAAGASAAFTFAITNEASTQQLGSVQISAPPGFVITGAPGSAGFTSSSALFLGLSLEPSATATLTVNADAPCNGTTYQWGIEAKQANDFSGLGNDFQIDPESVGNLSGTLTGSCSLAFASEPANNTAAGSVITSAFNSGGGPITVEVLDATHQVDASSTAAVTMAIGANPGSGSLSGTTTVNADAGVATFSDLSINASGMGYTLVATSPGFTSATSDPFNISMIQPCSGSSCSGSASSTTTMGTVTTSPTTSGESLSVGIGGASYSCAGTYQPVSDPFSFDLFKSDGTADPNAKFNGMLEISKSAVQGAGRTGVSSWEMCYASTQPFTALSGTAGTAVIGGVTFNTGLLPDCSSSQGSPCIKARSKDNAGDILVDFLASGDPLIKG